MSDPNMNELLNLLGEVNNLLEGTPEGAEVFARLRAGEINADEAARKLGEIASKAGLIDQLREANEQVNELLPSGPLTPDSLEKADRPVEMKTSTGIRQLNPLYEAAIAERASLDGDVPELRTGPLPDDEEARPAVPVKTTARDPVAIGLMLERASNEVKKILMLDRKEHRDLCQRLLSEAEETATMEGRDVTTALELTEKRLPPVPTGLPGYEAGKAPALREVEPPDPHVTAVMSPELRRVAIHNVIATTQGRRSTAPVIEAGVREHLEARGIPLREGVVDYESPRTQTFGWGVEVYGPDDLHEGYNPIQAAISSFGVQIEEAKPEEGWVLSVAPYNEGIAQRRFGWVAWVGPAQEVK